MISAGINTTSRRAAISACEMGPEWQLASTPVISTMAQAKVERSTFSCTWEWHTISYHALISACTQGREWQLTLAIVSTTAQARVGRAQAQALAQAQAQVMRHTISYTLERDTISYVGRKLAVGSLKGREWQLALGLLRA
jgi:hypothetical protein